jgi:hypothetical protein
VKLFIILLAAVSVFSFSAAFAQTGGGERYPAEVVKDFMDSCASDKRLTAYCSCTIEHLQNGMTLNQFVTITSQGEQAMMNNPVFMGAVQTCLPKAPPM